MNYMKLIHLPKSLIENNKSCDRNPCPITGRYMVVLFQAGRKERKQREDSLCNNIDGAFN